MKSYWVIKKLSDICYYQRGLTYSKKDEVEFSSNVVLRANNVDLIGNTLNLSELRYISEKVKVPENKKVKEGSLLICTASGSKSHLGKVALIDKDYGYAFGGFMGQLTPHKDLDVKYLYYQLTSDKYLKFIDVLADGANINNLKFNDLGKFEFLMPPLPEQRRIVKILDEVFAAAEKVKENAEKNLENAREVFYSYLTERLSKPGLGWEHSPLGDLCDIKTGKKDVNEGNPNGKYPFFTCAREHTYSDDYSFDTEALLIAGNGDVGQVSYYKGKFEAYQRTYVLSNFKRVKASYLFHLLNGPLKRTVSKQKLGNTMPYIKVGMLTNYMVAFPSQESEQLEMEKKLDLLSSQTKKLEEIYRQKLTLLEELKKSVLHKAFTGEL